MSVAELNELEEVKGLVTRGQRVGLLTFAEIVTATADVGLDETDAETLHGLLERRGIELVDELDPAAAVTPKIERATEKHGRRNARQDLTPDGTTDALQLLFRDVGKAGLLTAKQEVDLAKRIASCSRPACPESAPQQPDRFGMTTLNPSAARTRAVARFV